MIKNIEKEVQEITKWIKEYVEKTNAKGVVVGNSGGKDCATVIALATKALGKERVLTVAMPCNSIKADLENTLLLRSRLMTMPEYLKETDIVRYLLKAYTIIALGHTDYKRPGMQHPQIMQKL